MSLSDYLDDCGQLLCRVCRHGFTHHGEVEVFQRAHDEDPQGLRVLTTGNRTTALMSDLRGNPSSRRCGIVIRIWCEACHQVSTIDIAQHKGVTTVTYEPGGGTQADWLDGKGL